MMLGLAGFWVGERNVQEMSVAALLTLVGGWLTWRSLRGGIVIHSEGVEVRGELRTRFVPWSEVDRFYVGANWSVIPWSRLYVRTTRDEAIVAPYVASIGPLGPRLDRLAEELNERRRPG